MDEYKINIDYFLNNDKLDNMTSNSLVPESKDKEEPTKKKRTPRKKKETAPVEMIAPEEEMTEDLPMTASTVPYLTTYDETNNVLKQAILQIDVVNAQINQDIDTIRSSKSIRNKYTVISNLTSAMAGLIGQKIGAVKEINSTITNSHNLDMKRVKELNAGGDQQSDEAFIQSIYRAHMNADVDPLMGGALPNTADISMFNLSQGFYDHTPAPQQVELTPELNAIIQESNPYCEEVVLVNDKLPAPNNMRFAYIDTRTGQEIPNMKAHDSMFLSNLVFQDGMARDQNLNLSYKVYPDLAVNNQDSFY